MAITGARTIVDRIRGSDYLATFAPKYRSGILQVITKVPGVDNTVIEDALAGNVVASQVVTDRTNEREKTTTTLDATIGYKPDLVYHDQDWDEKFNLITPVDRYLTARGAEYGMSGRRITGINPTSDEVETFNISAAQAFMDAYSAVLPGRVRIEFPPVMTGFDFLVEDHIGSGAAGTNFAFGSWSGSGSYTLPLHSEAQASAAVIPEFVEFLAPEKGNHRYLATKKVVFFLPSPVTESAVLTKLATILGVSVTDWPNFNPQEAVVVLVGREGSLRCTADYHFQDGGSSTGHEHAEVGATGFSKVAGLTIKTTRVRPSIHADLTGSIPSPFSGGGITVTATAAGETITETMSGLDPGFAFYNFGATPGATAIPSSGIRLMRTESELYKYGYVMIQCETFDFSLL